MADRAIGLLHPGEMGAAIGAALRANGCRVGWASAGRSDEVARRLPALEAAGVDEVIVDLDWDGDPAADYARMAV